MYMTDLAPQVKILIVEDDVLYKKVIRAFLQEDSNFIIAGETKDGKTAVCLAKKLRPDVVIIDSKLPVISGIEATMKIKEENPSIKVIFLTPHSTQDEAIEAVEAGATAYVNKDINLNHLKMVIETVNKGAIWIAPFVGEKILSKYIKNKE